MKFTYDSPSHRLELIRTMELLGWRLLSDTFYPDRRELVFTSDPEAPPRPTFIDAILARLEKLEGK